MTDIEDVTVTLQKFPDGSQRASFKDGEVKCSDHHRTMLETHQGDDGAMFARALQRFTQDKGSWRAPGHRYFGPVARGSCRTCGTRPFFGMQSIPVTHRRALDGSQRASFLVEQCKSLRCPVCSRPVMLQKASRTALTVRNALEQGKGLYHGAFTIKHAPGDSLEMLVGILRDSYKGLRGGGKYRDLVDKIGAGRPRFVYSIENTWGKYGHHPHLQFLAYFERRLSRAWKMEDGSVISQELHEKIAEVRDLEVCHAKIPKHLQRGKSPRFIREAIRELRRELFDAGCWNEFDLWTTAVGELWRETVVRKAEEISEGKGKDHEPGFLIGVTFTEIREGGCNPRGVGRYLIKQGLCEDTTVSELGLGFEVASGGMFKTARAKGNHGPFGLLVEAALMECSEKMRAYLEIDEVLGGKPRWAVGLKRVEKWLQITEEDIEEWMASEDEDPEIAPDWVSEEIEDELGHVDRTVWKLGTQRGLDLLLLAILNRTGGRFVETETGQSGWVEAHEFVRCWLGHQSYLARGCRTYPGFHRILAEFQEGLRGFKLPPGWGLVREADGFLPCPLDAM